MGDAIQLGGFRLCHFSAYNWGTFDGSVVTLSPLQCNSLLTGNIGSGKSTLVDGLTTLLVPPRKLAFNKAAGAEDKERSLESYFHGYYTSQQDDYGKARSIGLRQGQHYSVLLAEFHSEALEQSVTLAQVFWLKPNEKKVRRLFVVADHGLSISEHFSGFGSQMNQLRKKLRKHMGIQLFDVFSQYAQSFSKLLGLGADGKALELFNQTISMKSVGSVTDFVRQNMLEQPDVESQLVELEQNYDDLKRLHDSVVAARKKVELLTPVDTYGMAAIDTQQQKRHFEQCRDVIDPYMAKRAIVLYENSLATREKQLKKLKLEAEQLELDKNRTSAQIEQLGGEINRNGGGRLSQLEQEINTQIKHRDQSRKLCDNYLNMVDKLQLDREVNATQFIENINLAKDKQEALIEQKEQLDEELFGVKQQQQALEHQQLENGKQLNALKQRKSNIHVKQLNLRERLCEQLGVSEEQLPFVGELIQVKASESRWQGAVERVLHNFALSLMVPEDLYLQVCDFVEHHHLGTRLVYYRIRQHEHRLAPQPDGDSLVQKVEIKSDSDNYDWLYHELFKRFDYHCCEDMATFRRSEKAITPNGQIKTGKARHEKDDRHNINDKSRYVLGWSNQEKIALLEAKQQQLTDDITCYVTNLDALRKSQSDIEELSFSARNLAQFQFSFNQINWPSFSDTITKLEQEKCKLESSSNILVELQKQLDDAKQEYSELDRQSLTVSAEVGKRKEAIDTLTLELNEKKELINAVALEVQQQCFPTLDVLYQQHVDSRVLRIDMLTNITSILRQKSNEKVQHLEEKRRKQQARMISAMGDFANAFPNDVLELDRSPEALSEYQQLLTGLIEEDLPRHEARFKEMLNRDTIRAMALFRSSLDRQEEEINARIHLINQALHDLDYQVGTYIEIDSITSPDIEIRDFKQRLKSCVEFSTDDSLYSEEKFERVKDLIEQMRNEPKWTKKVVDVRFWHLFNVVERYREDGTEKECYSDSGGKSGGQKEKLAYSILAAAILLQYGLVEKGHASQSSQRRFNLVVIDEAFARGSKDSTRFGLELFKRLGLQLLLVTPLQKLDVIEHYVNHVHFVDHANNRSVLLNMTIEQYRDRLSQHKQLQKYQHMVQQNTPNEKIDG
ncbi:ATP-binding protein [Vibrio breoganii]